MKYALDTNIITYYLKGKKNIRQGRPRSDE